MLKPQLLSIISKIRMGATSPTNISDSLEALATNPPYGGTAITTTLPTVLAQGEQVIYRDPNGVQSLWIGNADGEAWPSVGYKTFRAKVTQSSTNAPTATVLLDDFTGTRTWGYLGDGEYTISLPITDVVTYDATRVYNNAGTAGTITVAPFGGTPETGGFDIIVSGGNGSLTVETIEIRVYP
jgi:hypothetical protein